MFILFQAEKEGQVKQTFINETEILFISGSAGDLNEEYSETDDYCYYLHLSQKAYARLKLFENQLDIMNDENQSIRVDITKSLNEYNQIISLLKQSKSSLGYSDYVYGKNIRQN
jgi:hypothetical protein